MTVDAFTAQHADLANTPRRLRLEDRLLAHAVTAWERLEPNAVDDPHADAIARAAGGDLENRVVIRSRAVPMAPALGDALRHVRSVVALMILAGSVLAAVAGAGVARAALGSQREEPVNFFWALGSVLGLQTVILVIWIIVIAGAKAGSAQAISIGSLGGLLFRAAQWVSSRLSKGPLHAAAVAATGAVFLRGRLAKWTLSAISNGLWLSFNVGCLMVLILLLSSRQYTFGWETTILSKKQYGPITQAIAFLPKWAGFPVPNAQEIADTEWDGLTKSATQSERFIAARQPWSGLLVGAIVLYGLGPRLLLLGLCLGQRRHAAARYRLDLSRPEFLHWQSRLMPESESIGVVDRDEVAAPLELLTTGRGRSFPARPVGLPAIVGFELPAPPASSLWPPALHGVRWLDLGRADTRDDQRRVLQQLGQSSTEPHTLAVVCSLTATPDRGVASFLRELQAATARPLTLVLTGGEALRHRGETVHVEQRSADWRSLAGSAGVPPEQIIDVDLDHLTQASAANLAAVIGLDSADAAVLNRRRIEQAFALIADLGEKWWGTRKAPTAAERADLHRRIAGLYRNEQASWKGLFAAPASLGANAAGHLKASAERVIGLLPARLRVNPRWLAAGAAAGALGCVAAAAVLSPVAIAGLPMWSGIGAALAALLHAREKGKADGSRFLGGEKGDGSRFSDDCTHAVRAAALFAILLELQGRDEIAITRILDRVIDVDNDRGADRPLDSTAAIQTWLDELSHRLDMALAAEAVR